MSNSQKEIILLIQKAPTVGSGAVVAQEIRAKELHLKAFPHPRGYGMMIIDLEDQFYELQSTQPRKFSSWFINQRVSSSQTVYMANIFDPRFLCLPFLEKAGAKYSPLDQIIHMDEKYARFPFQRVSTWKMQDICDVNDKLGDDMILYRYNESKVIDWLKGKVGRTAAAFMKQRLAKMQNTTFASGFNVSKQSTGAITTNDGPSCSGTLRLVGGSLHCPMFVIHCVAAACCKHTADTSSKEDIVMALEVVSDYLTPAMAERLLKAYNMTPADLNTSKAAAAANLKRKADWEQELEVYFI